MADQVIGVREWNGYRIPENWLPAIHDSSDKHEPMGAIVRGLIRMSSKL
jgi:hypothetical protein